MATPQERLVSFRMETKTFRRAMRSFLEGYAGNHSDNVKRLGFEALRRTILRTTRVDLGRMINGWHVSFHRPSDWTPPPVARAPKGQTQILSNAPRPDPGSERGLEFLFLQNNVFYAPFHEFGTRNLSPLLMLTQTVTELRREIQRFLTQGTDIIWNREINGVTGRGLSRSGQIRKRQFQQQFRARRSSRR